MICGFLAPVMMARTKPLHRVRVAERPRRKAGDDGDDDRLLIEDFDQGRILGFGGFSVVREAVMRDSKVVYALKVTSKKKALEVSRGKPLHHSLLCEIRALALCNSPFLANMQFAFQDEYRLYLVLEIGTHGDLRQLMESRQCGIVSEKEAQFFVAQVALALSMCHTHGVLHRDVKPENIVLSASGYVKLTDFGIARIPETRDDCRSTSGTHGYMPPELYRPPHSHGAPADWFALGVTLYELVLGRKPFSRQVKFTVTLTLTLTLTLPLTLTLTPTLTLTLNHH